MRNLPDKEKAAKILSQIRNRLTKSVNYLNTNIDSYKKRKEGIQRMKKNYRPNNISESSCRKCSYSINKGEKIVFCNESGKLTKMLWQILTL